MKFEKPNLNLNIKMIVTLAISVIVAVLIITVCFVSFYKTDSKSVKNEEVVESVSAEDIEASNVANTPNKISLEHSGNVKEMELISHTMGDIETLEDNQAFWYQMSSVPKFNQGTVVFFAKGINLADGDIINITTKSGGESSYIVVDTSKGIQPQTAEWSQVGETTFNRTTGPEQLIMMVVKDKAFDVVVLDPLKF